MLPRCALLVLPLLVVATLAHGADFVAGTEDLPLMPGLAQLDTDSVVFDKPEGRIVEAKARGKLSLAAVRDFYGATLPQLGWHATGGNAWRREGEMLHLVIEGRDGDLTVGFTLSPQQEPRP
jgi:hypothetical protein